MKESGSNVVHKHGMKHISSIAHTKDMCVIKDDNKGRLPPPAEQKKASIADIDYVSVSIPVGL